MKYQAVLFLLLLVAIIVAPASADLKKIYAKAPVFVGESGLDISSALNGCRQIAWWPGDDSTEGSPGKVITIRDDEAHSYSLDPALFSNYTGNWYSYDKAPYILVFSVKKPSFDLRIWDLDHNRDVTGESIPVGTRITYRIDTNLYLALNKYLRPDINNRDTFIEVALTGPTGKSIENIYTGSAGLPDTVVLPLDKTPRVKESPYYWSNGGRWNRSSRGGDGTVLYPLGTYTFTARQNLNSMDRYYNSTDPVIATGPRTVTFVAGLSAGEEPAPAQTATVVPATTLLETLGEPAMTSVQPVLETPAAKETWTSTPLPWEVAIVAVCSAAFAFSSIFRRPRF